MSLPVTCLHCGASLDLSPQVSNAPTACPRCGHVISQQQTVEADDNEVIEVADTDVVVLEEDFADEPELEVELVIDDHDSNVEPIPAEVSAVTVSPTAPLDAAGPATTNAERASGNANAQATEPAATRLAPALVATAGAGGAFILLMLVGVTWWFLSPSALRESRALDASELPWNVADANRHLRHNKPPIEQPAEREVKTIQPATSPTQAPTQAAAEGSPASPSAAETNPARDRRSVIDEIKAATIYIRVTTSEGVQSGSGFLLRRSSSGGTIVTNAHVVEPEEGKLESIECTFFSGTSREFSVAAKVSCKDSQNDLAFLSVYHEQIPEPVQLAEDVEVGETDIVLAAGFPLGEVLKTSNRNPSITITRGSVSSLRLDDYDSVSLLQIDGGIDPGNSGGPVVLEDGRLVGVAVAKVRGTDIGFAIPTQVLQQTIQGRLTRVKIEKTDEYGNRYEFEIRFIDPSRRLYTTDLIVFRGSDQTIRRPDEDGSWRPAAEKLLLSKRLRTRRFILNGESLADGEFTLPSDDDLMIQMKFGRRVGAAHWSQPLKFPSGLELGVATQVPLTRQNDKLASDEQRVEPSIAVLPAIMSDFAINPSTGDIASLDPAKNRIYLTPAEQLSNPDYLSAPHVSIDEAPCAVTFKRYKERDYFVVACAQDSHLYLYSAELLDLVQKIPVAGSQLSQLAASSNSEDPFVYYGYGSDNDSKAGAIDLRRMTDCGKVFDNSTHLSISADGRFAYRRKSRAQPGFDSLRMTAEFADAAPRFERFHFNDQATGPCLPGPLGQFVASGQTIYSAGLDKQVFAMSFTPGCFFTSRPVIAGINSFRSGSSQVVHLRAASLNTFETDVAAITIPQEVSQLAHGRQPEDTKQVEMRTCMLADDKNHRVIYAARNKLALVPLEVFGLRDDEPFLNLASTATDLRVGVQQRIELRATSDKVTIEVNELPEGMKQVIGGLSWKPRNVDVGTTTVPITLRFEKAQRNFDYQVNVQQAWVEIPVELGDFLISPDDSFCVCWSGRAAAESEDSIEVAGSNREHRSQLCVIPLRRGHPPIRQELSFVICQAALLGSRVGLLSADDDRQVHLFDLRTLRREKLLLSTAPIRSIEVRDQLLLLHGDEEIELYSTQSLQRMGTIPVGSAPPDKTPPPRALVDGTIVNGVLHRKGDFSRALLLDPGTLPTLPGAQPNLIDGSFLRRISIPQAASSEGRVSQSNVSIVAGPLAIAEQQLHVSLENRVSLVAPDGSYQSRRRQQHVTLLVSGQDGSLIARVPILKQWIHSNTLPSPPVMHVSGGMVLIGCGSRLYRWLPSSLELDPNREKLSSNVGRPTEKLHFVPTQSAFLVKDLTTLLHHQLAGGNPPYDFFLMNRISGAEIDQQTGDLTLSRAALLKAAIPLLSSVAQDAGPGDLTEVFLARSQEAAETCESLTGASTEGFPIAVPIHVKATDRQGNVAEIQYFVLLDILFDEVTAAVGLGQ